MQQFRPRHRRRQGQAFRRYGFIALLCVVLLSALPWLLVTLFVNVDSVRIRIENSVAAATGRKLTFGRITMLRSLPPTLAAENVSLANIPGGSRPEMLKIPYAEATLRTVPLLMGRLDVSSLMLSQPDLVVETGAGGVGNWQFAGAPAAVPVAPRLRRTRWARRHAAERNAVAVLELLRVRDGKVSWREAGGAWTSLVLRRLEATSSSMQGPAVLTALLARDGREANLRLQTGPLRALRAAAAPRRWPVNLRVETTGAVLGVDGTFDDARHLGGYRLTVDGTADNLADIGTLLHRRLPPMRRFAVHTVLVDSGRPMPDVSGISLRAGNSDLDGWVPGLQLQAFDLAADSFARPVRAEVSGSFADRPLQLKAELGPPAALLSQGVAPGRLPIEISLEAGGGSLTLKGAIAAPEAGTGLQLEAAADVPDLSLFAPLFGDWLPAWHDVSLRLKATDGKDGFRRAVAFHDVAFAAVGADLGGDAELSLGARPLLRAAVHGRLDIDALRAGTATPRASTAAGAPPSNGWVVPTGRLNFGLLDGYDLDLTTGFTALKVFGVSVTDAAAAFRLRDGQLRVDHVSGTLPGGTQPNGRISGHLALNVRPRLPPMQLSFSATGLPARPLMAALGLPADLDGELDAGGDLSGAGASWHDIAASLTGRAGLAITGGDVGPHLLDALFGAVFRVAGETLPSFPTLAMNCLAFRLDAARGLLNVPSMIIDAPPLRLAGEGAARMADERVALKLRAANGGTALPPARVGGLLAAMVTAPDQRIDDTAVAAGDSCAASLVAARAAIPSASPGGNIAGSSP